MTWVTFSINAMNLVAFFMRIALELKKEIFDFNFDSITYRVPTGHGNLGNGYGILRFHFQGLESHGM